MNPTLGIVFAFVAFLAWGFGDFTIQRSARRIGSLPALFAITVFGAVVLLPFVWHDLPELFSTGRIVAIGFLTVVVTTITAIFEFEAFRKGKMAVIEPVMSFELVLTVGIGILILKESTSLAQLLLTLTVFTGILLTVLHRTPRHWWQVWRHRSVLEKGVILAALGAVAMSLVNILTGVFSQDTNPWVAIWFIHTCIAVFLAVWFTGQLRWRQIGRDIRKNAKLLLTMSIFDNAAWLAFAASVLYIPISLSIAISESYIALASLLGIIWNKEKLQTHQVIGMVLTITAAVALAVVSV